MQTIRYFVFGLVNNKCINSVVIERANSMLKKVCKALNVCFGNNGNISESHLYKDGLHLLDSGKGILANNFINSFNYFLKPPFNLQM